MRQFGTKREAAQTEPFLFFDETVRFSPSFGEIDLIDFLEAAREVDAEAPSAMSIMKDTFRACIHPEDFDRFWTTARRERQGVLDLMPILWAAVESVTDRPTQRPSDSSDGPQIIEPKSADASSSRVVHRFEQQGRPDLALLVEKSTAGRRTA